MPTIRELFKRPEITVHPFAIMEHGGVDVFVIESESMGIDGDGRLVFVTDGEMVGAVESGQWQRVVRGITLEDLAGEK